jgi:hypothetical protein
MFPQVYQTYPLILSGRTDHVFRTIWFKANNQELLFKLVTKPQTVLENVSLLFHGFVEKLGGRIGKGVV